MRARWRRLMYSTALARSARGQFVCGAVGRYGAGPNSGSMRTGVPRLACVVHISFHHVSYVSTRAWCSGADGSLTWIASADPTLACVKTVWLATRARIGGQNAASLG